MKFMLPILTHRNAKDLSLGLINILNMLVLQLPTSGQMTPVVISRTRPLFSDN